MPTEGTAAIESLQAALHDAESFVASCEQSATELDGRVNDLLARRGDALLQLARHFLPEISRPATSSNQRDLDTNG